MSVLSDLESPLKVIATARNKPTNKPTAGDDTKKMHPVAYEKYNDLDHFVLYDGLRLGCMNATWI